MSSLRAAGPAAISVRDRPDGGPRHAGQLRATGQSRQLDEEGGSQQLDVEAADELDGGSGGATRGQQVVDHQGACPGREGVLRDLHHGASVLEFVAEGDRKSTRLNSSHVAISYAVFCL